MGEYQTEKKRNTSSQAALWRGSCRFLATTPLQNRSNREAAIRKYGLLNYLCFFEKQIKRNGPAVSDKVLTFIYLSNLTIYLGRCCNGVSYAVCLLPKPRGAWANLIGTGRERPAVSTQISIRRIYTRVRYK